VPSDGLQPAADDRRNDNSLVHRLSSFCFPPSSGLPRQLPCLREIYSTGFAAQTKSIEANKARSGKPILIHIMDYLCLFCIVFFGKNSAPLLDTCQTARESLPEPRRMR
jgi:hypothetical protein